MLVEIPRFHRRARAAARGRRRRPGAGRHHAARLPRRRRLLGVLPAALHGAAGRGGVVLRPRPGAGLPGALPLRLPASTTACSASSARRSGAPSPAARAATSTRVAAGLHEVRPGTKVTSVLETPTGVEVTDGNGEVATYDAVVVATHPGQALAMLAEPTPAQRDVLGAMPYSPNTALLHTDASLLPRARDARASWNFRRPAGRARAGHRHLRPHPAAAAAHRHPLPGHAGRRATSSTRPP